jgi:preprotein translocase SecF subunit
MLIRISRDTKFGFMRIGAGASRSRPDVVWPCALLHVGMNFGIDFKGGTSWSCGVAPQPIGLAARACERLGFGEVEVQEFGAGATLAARRASAGRRTWPSSVVTRLRENVDRNTSSAASRRWGARVSGELVQSGTLGVLLSLVAILVYLWFRFEWQFAIGAVIATLHDIVLTMGFFAISQIEFNMTSIAAILTIIGYSLNDTVVVYDRIRETMRKYKRMSLNDLLDRAMNDTLTRTIITGVSTGLALIALAIFGGEVLKSFSYAMLFGLVVGTYSSVFIAAPILIYLGLKQGAEVGVRRRSGRQAPQPAE